MRVEVLVVGKLGEIEKLWFDNLLDHAWLKKADVCYNQTERELVIRLERYAGKTKARKKFFGFVVWRNCIAPTQDSLLTIKDIEQCEIKDDEPNNPQREQVITGGLVFNDEEIYIGSFCEHENSYGITLKVKRINITLEDL